MDNFKEIEKKYSAFTKFKKLDHDLRILIDTSFEEIHDILIDSDDPMLDDLILSIMEYVSFNQKLTDSVMMQLFDEVQTLAKRVYKLEHDS